MRGVRWILLLAILAIVVAVGSSYYLKKARQVAEAPPSPPELPPNVEATSEAWVHTEYDGDRPVFEIWARRMRQIREPSEFELEDVRLRIFHEDKPGYFDRVTSALARYDVAQGELYSDGVVEITLDAHEGGDETDLMVIRSSGVRFDTKSGKATTERPTSFSFERGEGKSVGATYEPAWSQIRMHSQAKLKWYGANGDADAMIVEAGELIYKWDLDKVDLNQWSRFRKGPLTLEAADSIVFLKKGAIRQVNAQQAEGTSAHGERRLEFGAEELRLYFDESERMERIFGLGRARLLSRGLAAETEVRSKDLTLEFRPGDGESVLDYALAKGAARLQSRPLTPPGEGVAPTRVLRSDVIKTLMRPGGEQIELIETHAPATLELLPNDPRQARRRLDGDRITIRYDEGNLLRSIQASNARTRTEKPAPPKGEAPPPALTWSDRLEARFKPETAEMSELRQQGHFRYEEGEQKATAERATFAVERNQILLAGKARLWNAGGSTAADRIIVNQAKEIITATGNVSSTHLPEPGGSSTGMLSADKPVHATAGTMQAAADGSYILYEGHAVLWQDANRLTGDRVAINRSKGVLKAEGQVVSRFREEGLTGETYTVVSAEKLTYLEEHRSAYYEGGVHLTKPGLDIRSRELTAYFKEEQKGKGGGGTSLSRALADGSVVIIQETDERVRKGIAEHASYFVDEEKVTLTGGRPKMIDSVRGATQGERLTYFAGNDRLLVDGATNRPAVSKLRKK